jgi:hypothetical protein
MENHPMMCKVYIKLPIIWAVLRGVFVNSTSQGGVCAETPLTVEVKGVYSPLVRLTYTLRIRLISSQAFVSFAPSTNHFEATEQIL